MVARRKRSDARKRADKPSARTKAGRKTATRPLARKKAARKKKPRLADVDSSTQVEAFDLLVDRLWGIYRRADERAADVQQEIQDKLEDLRGELENAVEKVTKTTCGEIEALLVEVEDRNKELQDRVLTGEIATTR
jgi:hypothetical protein